MAEEKPTGTGPDVANLVAAGFAVLTGAAGVVGGLTGGLARLARNDPSRIYWALGFALVAVGLALVAARIPTEAEQADDGQTTVAGGDHPPQGIAGGDDPPQSIAGGDDPPPRTMGGDHLPSTLGDGEQIRLARRERRRHGRRKFVVTIIAFMAFAASSAFMVNGLSRSLRNSDLPRVAGTWRTMGSGELDVLTVTVKMSGLKTSDILNVTVRPGKASQSSLILAPFLVYQSRTGADPDGLADLTFDVPLPKGYAALQVVANLGEVPVTCAGKVVESNSQNKPPVATTKTPEPSSQPTIFSCLTLAAPAVSTPSSSAPSPSVAPTSTRDP